MKLSTYFKIVKPNYLYLKLTPCTSIRNYNSDQIAKTIASLYKALTKRFEYYNKQFCLELPVKASYYIYISKNRTEFYFIVPDIYLSLFEEKINNTWKGITITQVETIPSFSENALKYNLNYKKEDAMSLITDKRTNVLLSSLLNVIDVMEEKDKIGIVYNFVALSQKTWRADYERTIEKLKNDRLIEKNRVSVLSVIKILFDIVLGLADLSQKVIDDFFGESAKPKPPNLFTLSNDTMKKKSSTIIGVQGAILAESADRQCCINNAHSVCQSFALLSADNEIVTRRSFGEVNINQYYINNEDVMKMTARECQQLLALPGRELLESHGCIQRINTHETAVPKELREGSICVGTNIYKGKEQKAYITTDRDFKNLALTLIGPTRAGKTTLISNIASNAESGGECVILFDFCGNNELSDDVSSVIDNVLNIDCSDTDNLQGMGYNEANDKTANVFDAYRNAKVQASQLQTLVNSINSQDKTLPPKMERYLESAALVVFISNGPIKDVFELLQNHETRQKYVTRISKKQDDNLREYITSLRELNETDKNGNVIGTRISNIAGIIDRVNKLKQNTYMELMLKKDCRNNINLVEELQTDQLICLRMPEVMFSTETEKDIYCTYWITKIWLALQIRKWKTTKDKKYKLKKVNVFIDELYQVPRMQDFIRAKLSQMAKFQCKMIISCHYLGQINIIRDELKAANSSYMLISGCDKDNFKELKEDLYPYILEDLLNLDRYKSLNLMKYEKGYAKFITKLPPPIKKG